MKRFGLTAVILLVVAGAAVTAPREVVPKILIPMDDSQSNHLRAYGVTYYAIQQGFGTEWLLNYRGGSFLIAERPEITDKANLMGVSYKKISAAEVGRLYREIDSVNMAVIPLEKAPRVAVYHPPKSGPWDDAVTMALKYAEIPFTVVYDPEVLAGKLSEFDWLHLHHEDFTGQYGKFYGSFRDADWYRKQVAAYRKAAEEAGFKSVREHKLAVAKAIRAYVERGGFIFAMCSAPDSLDVALVAEGFNIVPPEIGEEPLDPQANQKLNFGRTFAFKDFRLEPNPWVYEISDIDIYPKESPTSKDYFSLFDFSAKQDPVPTMLVQNHRSRIREFMGQTTAFHRQNLKDNVTILGEEKDERYVKYIHGDRGQGTFTFLGGHDPEDFQHIVGEQDTDLSLHPNSPGYRLILNNVLFPASKKEKKKT